MIAKINKFEFIESRWRKWNETPHVGEIFVGRCNDTVYNTLFLKTDDGAVYLGDTSTHIGSTYDFFTHWLHVGEVKE